MRDFQKVQQKNPHRLDHATPLKRFLRRFGFVVLLVLLYLASTTPPLRFQTFATEAATEEGRHALQTTTEAFLNRRSYFLFSNRSLLFFRGTKLEHDLRNTLPIERVNVAPAYRARHIVVSASFLKPAARLELAETTVLLDGQGRVLAPVLEPFDERAVLHIKATTVQPTEPQSAVLTPDDLERYRVLRQALSERGMPILWLVVTDDLDTFDFQMKDNWTLKVSREEPGSILRRLDIFFAERKKQPLKHPLQYVDVRFGDKIISKERL